MDLPTVVHQTIPSDTVGHTYGVKETRRVGRLVGTTHTNGLDVRRPQDSVTGWIKIFGEGTEYCSP